MSDLDYLPDEAYLPTPSEYERHYFMLVREIEQTLGPFFGAMPGPHPEVCRQCAEKGECVCGAPYLWIDTPGDLLFLAAEKLKNMQRDWRKDYLELAKMIEKL